MKKIIIALLALWLTNCKDSPKTKNKQTVAVTELSVTDTQETSKEAKLLLETKCYICHNPKASESSVIAPPMVAVKARYLKDHSSKEQFTNAIWDFVEKPSKEKAKMKGALNRFGVMPYQPFNEEEIRKISDYIFDYQIEEPVWFKKHWEKGHGEKDYEQKGKKMGHSSIQNTPPQLEKGMLYAQSTQKVLGKNLTLKLQQNGTVAALEFCNEKAITLTDSMATMHNATIKRVTNKPRNPANQASAKELEYLMYFKDKIVSNETYEPILVQEKDHINFYYPIITNSMCLTCHGNPKTNIQPEVSLAIQSKYPYDKAVGYNVNEVRGIWSITYEAE